MLILNRPAKNLLPNNIWAFMKHNSFVEVDKFMDFDDEKQDAAQILFENPDILGCSDEVNIYRAVK